MKLISPRCSLFGLSLCLVLPLFTPIHAEDREPAPEAIDIDVAKAEKLIAETEGIVVLDIRTPAEFAEGHIRGAINIDFLAADFAEKIAALDHAKPYLVHCRSGGRSGRSLEQFRKQEFRSIYHLTSGMNGWLEAGKPVEK